MNAVRTTVGFCSDCGSILPLLSDHGDIVCYTCRKSYAPEEFTTKKVHYTVDFNMNKTRKSKMTIKSEDGGSGPITERICSKCGNNKMTYATLQLRSVDEGQTVFYTCTNCGSKENENS